MAVTVIVPTYNEAQNLPILAEQLFALPIEGLSLLVIDDNSPDGTGQIAETLADKYQGRVEVIHREGKLGLGTAYVRGFTHALGKGANTVVQMDADLSHSPSYIPKMLARLEEADVVIGSRYVSGGGVDSNWSPLRKVLSRWGSIYSRALLGLHMHDTTGGFRCFRASALKDIHVERIASNGYVFQVEVIYLCQKVGLRIAEVPILFLERTNGTSKMSSKIAFEAAWRVWQIKLRS
ncbi:MAG: polyprenol monophosphomannose synthase [Dehalococcoidia bacterium]|nr:polyprenol monophosphomannose synthase [Dehalococcoidia bacterium]